MSSEPAAPRLDRRHLRRAETIEQVVDVAVQVMAEDGVAGLSLGEVARRIGIRPPSLYVYFPSKHAVYDAVFARGWRDISRLMEAVPEPDETTDLQSHLLESATLFVRWTVEHAVYTQLMGWRPVPGYEPSPEAYQPAIAALERGRKDMTQLQALGLFRADVSVDELLRAWTIVISGITTQQLANAPDEPFDEGTFTTLLPQIVAMYCAHYATRSKTRGRKQHADKA